MKNKRKKYKQHNPDGTLISYKKDDVVIWKGASFIAKENISGTVPKLGGSDKWEAISDERVSTHTTSTTSPPRPKNGDEWFNTTTGLSMKYIDDGTNRQWVEM